MKIYLSMDQIKERELEILKYVHNFCKKHNLKYFINYGTLLGAVRHKGFIPWDDDIDISMPRKDYMKFIKLFLAQKSHYKILSIYNNKKYFNNFIKIIDDDTVIEDNRNYKTYKSGVFIDIFPYDRFDNLKVVNSTYILESLKLLSFSKKENIQYNDSKLKDLIRRFFFYILKPINPKIFAYINEHLIRKYRKKNGKFVGLLASKFKYNEVFYFDTFDELIDIEFEGYAFKAPKNYDKILTKFYGDYNKLPEKNKRYYSHEIKAYLKERK